MWTSFDDGSILGRRAIVLDYMPLAARLLFWVKKNSSVLLGLNVCRATVRNLNERLFKNTNKCFKRKGCLIHIVLIIVYYSLHYHSFYWPVQQDREQKSCTPVCCFCPFHKWPHRGAVLHTEKKIQHRFLIAVEIIFRPSVCFQWSSHTMEIL